MADYLVTDTELTSIANAIRNKNNTSADISFPAGFVSAIQSISAEIANFNDVNFYDYDGRILYSYSASEFVLLTEMPPNPSHHGLTSQGWNWTLAQAKTFVENNGAIDIGEVYITDDGKTRLYIHIIDAIFGYTEIFWTQTDSNGVRINWGDGGNSVTISGSGNVSASHTYLSSGYYTITMECLSGTYTFGDEANGKCIIGEALTSNSVEMNKLIRVEIGSGVEYISEMSFDHCFMLKTITIPNGVSRIRDGAFKGNMSLNHVTFPGSMSRIDDENFTPSSEWDDHNGYLISFSMPYGNISVGWGTFMMNFAMRRAIFTYPLADQETIYGYNFYNMFIIDTCIVPNGYETFAEGSFKLLPSLTVLILPTTTWYLADESILLSSLKKLHIKATTPPTMAAVSSLDIPQDCIIYVPYSADHSILNAYKAATNWSSYSSQMQEEPQ